MNQAAVIIPNLNGMKYLPACLDSLMNQTEQRFTIWMIDNASEDESVSYVETHYPSVKIHTLKKNTGFCYATNMGIRLSEEPYVIFLNNDTECAPNFIEEMLKAIGQDERIFSCSAKMLSMDDPSLCDDAGDFYSALGWAFARGKGQEAARYQKSDSIFASCGGAAIYRRSILNEIGLLDEAHFAYLEDLDLGYRARLHGYVNRFAPGAVVLHKGSGSTGSRYNAFKVSLSSRNSIYVIRKNMPTWQIILNLPFLAAGYLIKIVFFTAKGLGKEYMRGLGEGMKDRHKLQKAYTPHTSVRVCMRIQLHLWAGVIRRIFF